MWQEHDHVPAASSLQSKAISMSPLLVGQCSISLYSALWVEALWKGKASLHQKNCSVHLEMDSCLEFGILCSHLSIKEWLISSVMAQKRIEHGLFEWLCIWINGSFIVYLSLLLGSCLISIQVTMATPFKVILCQNWVGRWHNQGDVNFWSHSI